MRHIFLPFPHFFDDAPKSFFAEDRQTQNSIVWSLPQFSTVFCSGTFRLMNKKLSSLLWVLIFAAWGGSSADYISDERWARKAIAML
jgi:hypothetical protein